MATGGIVGGEGNRALHDAVEGPMIARVRSSVLPTAALAASVAALATACGATARNGASTSDPALAAAPCLPVRVVDETGAPRAGWRVHAEVSAWVGPEGAFFSEGGQPLDFAGAAATTDAAGTACIEDPTARVAQLRQRADHEAAHPSGSMAIPYAGGFGPTRVGRASGIMLHAEHAVLPSIVVDGALTGLTPGPRELVVGPARIARVHVSSLCERSKISVQAVGNGATLVGTRVGASDDGIDVDIAGLGPGAYQLGVSSCGEYYTGELDASGPTPHADVLARSALVGPPTGRFVELAMGDERGCVVTDQHELGCFERLYDRPDLEPRHVVAAWITTPAPPVTHVAMNEYAACAITTAGEVRCWGYSGTGIVGPHATATLADSTPIALPAPATAIALGNAHACAQVATGAVLCWGSNSYGQLGVGERVDQRLEPVEVPAFRDARALALGSLHTCAITWHGFVACVGANSHGESSPQARGPDVTTPRVYPPAHDVVRLQATYGGTAAWDAEGHQWTWGTNSNVAPACRLDDHGTIVCTHVPRR